MATESVQTLITRPAAADLSSYQYRAVKIDSSGNVALAGEGDIAVGILQNKPAAAGRGAVVCVGGVSKMRGGASVSPGARFSTLANGLGGAVGSGDDQALGIVLEALASGTIGTVLVQPVGSTA
jgi:hypothetical protein